MKCTYPRCRCKTDELLCPYPKETAADQARRLADRKKAIDAEIAANRRRRLRALQTRYLNRNKGKLLP